MCGCSDTGPHSVHFNWLKCDDDSRRIFDTDKAGRHHYVCSGNRQAAARYAAARSTFSLHCADSFGSTWSVKQALPPWLLRSNTKEEGRKSGFVEWVFSGVAGNVIKN